MCLAIPARIVDLLPDEQAIVELDGIRKQISSALTPEASLGDYVIVHVGYAIGMLDPDEAQQTLRLFDELASSDASTLIETTDTDAPA